MRGRGETIYAFARSHIYIQAATRSQGAPRDGPHPICAHGRRQGGRTFSHCHRARALLSPSRRRRLAWHIGARGRGPSVQRWAATSHHRAWCAVPTASNKQRRRTKKVSCVCGLFHSGLVVMRCTRALSGWPRRVRSGWSPSVVMCKQCWRVDNESITTRARSTQVRQIDVWVTTEDPRGPRQVRLWWSRAGAPRRDVALALLSLSLSKHTGKTRAAQRCSRW